MIINETAVKLLGWDLKSDKDHLDPIGNTIVCAFDNEEELEVIGVVKDFNYNSLKQRIEPLIILHEDNDRIWNFGRGRSFISIRFNDEITNSLQLQQFIEQVETKVNALDPSVMFEYSFMDQDFDRTFKTEKRMALILNIFTLTAILIAGLGLIGLTTYAAEQRAKELGIRKVLGASALRLVMMLSVEIILLIFLAFGIAAPIAYLSVESWLEGYPHHTSIELWIFGLVLCCILTISLAMTGIQTIQTAWRNPVDTLKSE